MGIRQAGIARIGFRRLGAGAGLQAVLPVVAPGVFFADAAGAADTDANFGYHDADDALYSLQGGATYTPTTDAANVVIKKVANARISLRLDGGGWPNRVRLQNGSGASGDSILSTSLAGLQIGNEGTGNDATITIQAGAISITTGATLGASQVAIGWGSGPWVTFSGASNAVWGDGTAANPMIRFSSGGVTGLYCPAANVVGGAAGTAEKFRWDANGVQITGSRLRQAKGADVASATTLTLGADGNFFAITGTTQIQGIVTTSWQAGSRICLQLATGITIVHNSGAPGTGAVAILLAAGGSLTTTAATALDLVYDGTNWSQPSPGAYPDSLVSSFAQRHRQAARAAHSSLSQVSFEDFWNLASVYSYNTTVIGNGLIKITSTATASGFGQLFTGMGGFSHITVPNGFTGDKYYVAFRAKIGVAITAATDLRMGMGSASDGSNVRFCGFQIIQLAGVNTCRIVAGYTQSGSPYGTTTWTPDVTAYHDFAVYNNGGTVFLYVDGVQVGSLAVDPIFSDPGVAGMWVSNRATAAEHYLLVDKFFIATVEA